MKSAFNCGSRHPTLSVVSGDVTLESVESSMERRESTHSDECVERVPALRTRSGVDAYSHDMMRLRSTFEHDDVTCGHY